MTSALYEGVVTHRRLAPRTHTFSYRIFMVYLDLDELPGVFDRFLLWSARRPAIAWFRERDHGLGAQGEASRTRRRAPGREAPLRESIRDLVERRTGKRPTGPVRLLTHLRYFGLCFNPVSFYYCFEPDGETLACVVAEVDNTPWLERHAYVLSAGDARGAGSCATDMAADAVAGTPAAGSRAGSGAAEMAADSAAGTVAASTAVADAHPGARAGRTDTEPETVDRAALEFELDKAFHVSPFMPMHQRYRWTFSPPGSHLSVSMDSHQNAERVFRAGMHLRRREMTSRAMASALLRFPLMPVRVVGAIYWQALRLWLKGTPFFAHPRHGAASPRLRG